jgi:predicted  nucleic acid-binding Zn-ribbon protein
MDNELIAAIVAVLLAVAGWLKSHSEVNEVKADREQTKKDRDTKIALLEQQCSEMRKRLDDGDVVMKGLQSTLSELNANVAFIRGMLEGKERDL